jgi:hypothetical protein
LTSRKQAAVAICVSVKRLIRGDLDFLGGLPQYADLV